MLSCLPLLLSLQPPRCRSSGAGLPQACPEPPAGGTAGLCTDMHVRWAGWGARVSPQPLTAKPLFERLFRLSRLRLFQPCAHTTGCCPAPSRPGHGPECTPHSALRGVGDAVNCGLQALPILRPRFHGGWQPGADAAVLERGGRAGWRATGAGVSMGASKRLVHFPGTGGPGATGHLAGPWEPPVPTSERQRMGRCQPSSGPGAPAPTHAKPRTAGRLHASRELSL